VRYSPFHKFEGGLAQQFVSRPAGTELAVG
jgi:hypothetical protein